MTDLKDGMAEKLEKIMAKLEVMYCRFATLEQKIDSTKAEVVEVVNSSLLPLTNKLQLVEEKVINLEDRMTKVENKIPSQVQRRNNVLLYNVPEIVNEYYEELEKQVMDVFRNNLGTDIAKSEIKWLKRLGSRAPHSTRPILITLNSFSRKREVLKASKKLTGTVLSLSDDFSPEIRSIRKQLLPYRKDAIESGLKCTFKFDKLVIGGKEFTLDQLKNLKKLKVSSGGSESEERGKLRRNPGRKVKKMKKRDEVGKTKEKNEGKKPDKNTDSLRKWLIQTPTCSKTNTHPSKKKKVESSPE
uniref:Uncharacterized protein n=1 Tax=Rhodnius prolixus TaxID=13249 RepID=T1I9T9_RHOPR